MPYKTVHARKDGTKTIEVISMQKGLFQRGGWPSVYLFVVVSNKQPWTKRWRRGESFQKALSGTLHLLASARSAQ